MTAEEKEEAAKKQQEKIEKEEIEKTLESDKIEQKKRNEYLKQSLAISEIEDNPVPYEEKKPEIKK